MRTNCTGAVEATCTPLPFGDGSSDSTSGGSAAACQGQNLCFNYDSFGNRTQDNFQSTACSSSNPATASYSASNQMSGFTYDASGNVLYDGANYYSYDGDGRLCAMQTSSPVGTLAYAYLYDADGRRVARGTITPAAQGQPPSCNLSTNGFTLLDSYVLGQGGEELTTLDGNSKWERTNVYGQAQLLTTYDATGQGQHFHLSDPLGTRRVQTDILGEPEEECQDLPFGDQQICTGTDATPLHFTGKERDTESGLDYFGARYYGSSMGRFMSPDWASDPTAVPYATYANPQSLNLYNYMRNNPLSGTDPDGHCCDPDSIIISTTTVSGSIIGGLVGATAGAGGGTLVAPGFGTVGGGFEGGVLGAAAGGATGAAIGNGIVGAIHSLENIFSSSSSTPTSTTQPGQKDADFVVTPGGTAVATDPGRVRDSLANAPGVTTTPANSPSGETGTIQSGVQTTNGPVDVRTMDGSASHGPRTVITHPGTNNPKTLDGKATNDKNDNHIPNDHNRPQ